MNEILFWETDVWELSKVPLDRIKRNFVTMEYGIEEDFQVRVTTIKSENHKPTLVLCHDYMLAGCIQFFNYVKPLSEVFNLVIPDMGTMGANTRIYEDLSVSLTPEQSETFINLWFAQWVNAMGD